MKVTDPDGQVWRVSRRWVPWRLRIRDVDPVLPDLGSGTGGGGGGGGVDVGDAILLVLGFLALLAFCVFVLPFLMAALVAVAEFLLILLVLPFAVLGRVLFGRRWHVEIRRGWKPWTEVMAGDWQASGILIHDLAHAVRRGEVPARTL